MKKNRLKMMSPTASSKNIRLASPATNRGKRKNSEKLKIATHVPPRPGIKAMFRLADSILKPGDRCPDPSEGDRLGPSLGGHVG